MSHSPGGRPDRTQRWLLLSVVGLTAALVLSACGGSALDPKDVALANKAISGDSGPSGSASSSGPGVVDPTTGAFVDPSTGNPVVPGPGTSVADIGNPSSPTAPNVHVIGVPAPPTGQGVKAGSCVGFQNQTGITDSTITLANVADVTGPVPGFFTPAQQAAQAYVKYFNSTSSICGRKLAILPLDSQTNASADNTAWQKACESAFAGVGSMSAFDSGGAATTQRCGIPDLRALQTNAARTACTNCYAAEGAGPGQYENATTDYFLKHNRDATQKAAAIYVNEAASVSNIQGQVRAETRRGWKFVYNSSFDIAEFNYAPYVEKMKSAGVRLVQFLGSSDMGLRMVKAFQTANFKPDVVIMTGASYDQTYASGGSAAEGTIVLVDFVPLEEIASNPEMRLYYQWLQQVSPGAKMSYFGLYAWSATRLFVQQAVALGGKLSRATILQRIRGVQDWTANGLHAPQDVGTKGVSRCWRMIQLRGGAWKPYGGSKFLCGGSTSTS